MEDMQWWRVAGWVVAAAMTLVALILRNRLEQARRHNAKLTAQAGRVARIAEKVGERIEDVIKRIA